MDATPGPSFAMKTSLFYSKDKQQMQDPEFLPNNDENSETSDDDEEVEDSTVVLEIIIDGKNPAPEQPEYHRKKKRCLYWNHIQNRNSPGTTPNFENKEEEEEELHLLNPIDYFRKFISSDILDLLVEQSNLYAVQCDPGKPLKVTKSQMEQWLGLCLHMSLSKLPYTRLHWSGLDETVASIMSRDRWEQIKSKLHLVDNTTYDGTDKVFKVRPLIDHLRNSFRQTPMLENLCVDEQMVPFKGNSGLKQYIPKKPHKWRYKLFVLSDHKGYVYDFFPYTGKISPVDNANVPDLKPSANTVLQLAECIPNFKNHKLYFDNWFTAFPLIEHLATRGLWCCGTVQPRRLSNVTFKLDKQLTVQGRGSYDEWETHSEGVKVTAVKWMDKRSVHLASTFLNSFPMDKCVRYDKKVREKVEVPRPNIVKQYNMYMGGVDLCDQMISYYRTFFGSKKYYHRLFFHLIDLAVVNSWMLYRRDAESLKVKQQSQLPHCEFKYKLANSLMMSGKTMSRERGRPSTSVEKAFTDKKKVDRATKPIPDKDIRGDSVGHFPASSTSRAKCKLPGCNGKVHMTCIKCNVHLCCDTKRNCFLTFHTK
ncbi:hypothetical protein Pcinc_006587 [Petrolisthes cinctipes]|uniref:PiggyBac transposable element-derived protein domain-containing protein n=1 Tax=Petrolisthes cinctipes TaxID=88211 RepID=A0AAE1GA96_PETCI|nr:hypothetical protein Pcinc_006587 [Petrolisthes cinctipes]